jgi:flagellin-like protein
MGNTYAGFIFVKYHDPRVSGHRRIRIMRTMLKSKKGISPILATLLLIVIAVAAVIVTYAWVMTFTGSTTSQGGAVLSVENVRFYDSSGKKVEIVIRNSGTNDATVAEVYRGTSSSDLQQISVTYIPSSQMVNEGESLKITFSYNWNSGTRYYFKVVTEEGLSFPFNAEA